MIDDIGTMRRHHYRHIVAVMLMDETPFDDGINQTPLAFRVKAQFWFFYVEMNISVPDVPNILLGSKIFQTIGLGQVVEHDGVETLVEIIVL